MKSPFRSQLMLRRFLAAALALVLAGWASPLRAQPDSPAPASSVKNSSPIDSGKNSSNGRGAGDASGGAAQTVTGDLRKPLDDAKDLAKKKDGIAAAEQELTKTNKFRPNTDEWRVETSQKLLQAAHELAKEGDGSTAGALAAQALQHLNQTDSPSSGAKARAQSKALAGHIQEKYTGDPVAAIASYQAALQFDPKDKATKEALERLQKADANLRAKIHPSKK